MCGNDLVEYKFKIHLVIKEYKVALSFKNEFIRIAVLVIHSFPFLSQEFHSAITLLSLYIQYNISKPIMWNPFQLSHCINPKHLCLTAFSVLIWGGEIRKNLWSRSQEYGEYSTAVTLSYVNMNNVLNMFSVFIVIEGRSDKWVITDHHFWTCSVIFHSYWGYVGVW